MTDQDKKDSIAALRMIAGSLHDRVMLASTLEDLKDGIILHVPEGLEGLFDHRAVERSEEEK